MLTLYIGQMCSSVKAFFIFHANSFCHFLCVLLSVTLCMSLMRLFKSVCCYSLFHDQYYLALSISAYLESLLYSVLFLCDILRP